jgi:raffinose/stachyose/melibiose transport system permease protein
VSRVRRLPGWTLLLCWTVVVAVPLYLLVVSCFKTTSEIYADPFGLPTNWSLDNFSRAWNQANVDTYMFNSVTVTVTAVVVTILVSVMAAYPLSRYPVWWATPLLGFFLAGIMVPVRLGSVELFSLMRDLGLINSRLGLVLVYAAIRIPFAVFIFTNFLRAIPRELEEAARLDGAADWRVLFQILVPQIRSAVAIVAIFTAIAVWNDFYFPLLFIFDDSLKTVPLGMTTFVGQYRTDWGLLFAGLTMSMAPLFLLYLFTSRQVRRGVGAGAIK